MKRYRMFLVLSIFIVLAIVSAIFLSFLRDTKKDREKITIKNTEVQNVFYI